MADSVVSIAALAPDLLGTYGDIGNAVVLEQRLAWRGIDARVERIDTGVAVPESCDIYLLGGGEDAQQTLALRELARTDALERAIANGAVVLAVCAGFQILGHRFPGIAGADTTGLAVLDVETVRTGEKRAVGELLAMAQSTGLRDVGTLTGFENHGGRTRVGRRASALATVVAGVGNGFDGVEGAVQGKVVGTYMHGPVLARNPSLADLLLSWIVGPLAPLTIDEVDRLHLERVASARRPRWRRRR